MQIESKRTSVGQSHVTSLNLKKIVPFSAFGTVSPNITSDCDMDDPTPYLSPIAVDKMMKDVSFTNASDPLLSSTRLFGKNPLPDCGVPFPQAKQVPVWNTALFMMPGVRRKLRRALSIIIAVCRLRILIRRSPLAVMLTKLSRYEKNMIMAAHRSMLCADGDNHSSKPNCVQGIRHLTTITPPYARDPVEMVLRCAAYLGITSVNREEVISLLRRVYGLHQSKGLASKELLTMDSDAIRAKVLSSGNLIDAGTVTYTENPQWKDGASVVPCLIGPLCSMGTPFTSGEVLSEEAMIDIMGMLKRRHGQCNMERYKIAYVGQPNGKWRSSTGSKRTDDISAIGRRRSSVAMSYISDISTTTTMKNNSTSASQMFPQVEGDLWEDIINNLFSSSANGDTISWKDISALLENSYGLPPLDILSLPIPNALRRKFTAAALEEQNRSPTSSRQALQTTRRFSRVSALRSSFRSSFRSSILLSNGDAQVYPKLTKSDCYALFEALDRCHRQATGDIMQLKGCSISKRRGALLVSPSRRYVNSSHHYLLSQEWESSTRRGLITERIQRRNSQTNVVGGEIENSKDETTISTVSPYIQNTRIESAPMTFVDTTPIDMELKEQISNQTTSRRGSMTSRGIVMLSSNSDSTNSVRDSDSISISSGELESMIADEEYVVKKEQLKSIGTWKGKDNINGNINTFIKRLVKKQCPKMEQRHIIQQQLLKSQSMGLKKCVTGRGIWAVNDSKLQFSNTVLKQSLSRHLKNIKECYSDLKGKNHYKDLTEGRRRSSYAKHHHNICQNSQGSNVNCGITSPRAVSQDTRNDSRTWASPTDEVKECTSNNNLVSPVIDSQTSSLINKSNILFPIRHNIHDNSIISMQKEKTECMGQKGGVIPLRPRSTKLSSYHKTDRERCGIPSFVLSPDERWRVMDLVRQVRECEA